MFSTKIRTTIATLATFAVAVGFATAAQATKNDGRYQNSAEAHKRACSDLLEL